MYSWAGCIQHPVRADIQPALGWLQEAPLSTGWQNSASYPPSHLPNSNPSRSPPRYVCKPCAPETEGRILLVELLCSCSGMYPPATRKIHRKVARAVWSSSMKAEKTLLSDSALLLDGVLTFTHPTCLPWTPGRKC